MTLYIKGMRTIEGWVYKKATLLTGGQQLFQEALWRINTIKRTWENYANYLPSLFAIKHLNEPGSCWAKYICIFPMTQYVFIPEIDSRIACPAYDKVMSICKALLETDSHVPFAIKYYVLKNTDKNVSICTKAKGIKY